jgi:hypothetical protein
MKNKFINENTYLDASNDFVKELEKSKILADNIDVSVGPSQWGKPGELRFRDHVTLRAAGIETELYVIPRGSYTEFELYTDTGYDKGREVKVGDAKTIIKAMKRYVNKMNESMVNEAKVKLPKGIVKHKDIPTWAGWVAQHSDGEWTWYESYPFVVNFKDGGGAWKQEESEGYQIYTGVKTDPKNWKEGPYRVRYDGDVVLKESRNVMTLESFVNEGKVDWNNH